LVTNNQRIRLQKYLKENHSLKAILPEILPEVYQLAIISAEREAGLDSFPDICPFEFEQIFSREFLPDYCSFQEKEGQSRVAGRSPVMVLYFFSYRIKLKSAITESNL